jgi:hypothetical protein
MKSAIRMPAARDSVPETGVAQRRKKFFASFFQKRSASFPAPFNRKTSAPATNK